MLALNRPVLTARTHATLNTKQAKVDGSAHPVEEAKTSWRGFRGIARQEVLAKLRVMASGLERCMYCEDSMGTDIDHFRPKTTYPAYTFVWENHFLACSFCNSNQKRDVFPVDLHGDPLLIDLTLENPLDHLEFSPATGMYVGRTTRGEVTIEVFGLNREVCVNGRKDAWAVLSALCLLYESQSSAERENTLTVIGRYPFQGVRMWLSSRFASAGNLPLGSDVRDAFDRHPELLR